MKPIKRIYPLSTKVKEEREKPLTREGIRQIWKEFLARITKGCEQYE